MIALLDNASAVHDQNEICVLHGRNTLGNDDLGGVRQFLAEGYADQRIGLGIYRGGRIIQDQNTRFFQKCSRDTQALLLSAGYVGTAALNVSVIAVRKLAYELIGLGQLTCVKDFFICRVLVAPAHILLNGAGKQHVFLKHNRNRVT